MTKDPAFPFYSNDFETRTKFLSHEQVGKLIRLMITQHQYGHLTKKQILFICSDWDDELMEKFEIDEKGLYYNNRLDFEINKRKKFVESRKNNMEGHNQHKNRSSDQKMTSHMDNENENENESKKENKNLYLDCVLLSGKEHKKLIKIMGEYTLKDYLERLNNYKGINEKKFKGYSSHNAVIRSWWAKDGKKVSQKDIDQRKTEDFRRRYPDNPEGKKKVKDLLQNIG